MIAIADDTHLSARLERCERRRGRVDFVAEYPKMTRAQTAVFTATQAQLGQSRTGVGNQGNIPASEPPRSLTDRNFAPECTLAACAHFGVQTLDRVGARGHEEKRENAVQQAGDPRTHHAEPEATGLTKVPEVGLAYGGRVLSERAQ